jgi:hypothetical protein
VGDPHVKINNLKESEALLQYVETLAKLHLVDRIELLGDLFHNHAVIRLEVIEFWEKWLDTLSNLCETVVLEGNHDQSGDYGSDYSALSIFHRLKKPYLHIVTVAKTVGNIPIGYIPYKHDPEKFLQIANEMGEGLGIQTLVCHQTFKGSKYESGIYAPDGIDTDKISDVVQHIISGHIHSQQEFGRVDYPGTARWDTIADVNLQKGLWIYTHDNVSGKVIDKAFFSTEKVCSPIYLIDYVEGGPEPVIPENARVTLELTGSSEWIAKQKIVYKGRVMFKTHITDQSKLENRKTGNGFDDYLKNLFPSTMDRDHLLRLAKELNIL